MDSGCTFGALVSDNKFLNPTVGYRTVSGENATLYGINMEGDGHTNVTITRNYIQNYGVAIELSTPASGEGYWAHYWDWTDIKVIYNVIDGVGYQDHAYAYGIFWINETNLYPYYGVFNNIGLVNNTIIAHDGATYDGYQGIGIFANDTVNDLRVSNNIAYDFSNYGISVTEHGTDTLVLTGLDVTYNNMYSNGTNTVNLESAAGRITVSYCIYQVDTMIHHMTAESSFDGCLCLCKIRGIHLRANITASGSIGWIHHCVVKASVRHNHRMMRWNCIITTVPVIIESGNTIIDTTNSPVVTDIQVLECSSTDSGILCSSDRRAEILTSIDCIMSHTVINEWCKLTLEPSNICCIRCDGIRK